MKDVKENKELRELLEFMLNEELEQIVLSDSVSEEMGSKVKIRPLHMKGELYFQISKYYRKQIFHTNLQKEETIDRIESYLGGWFKQAQMRSSKYSAIVLVSKKGKMSIKKRELRSEGKVLTNAETKLSHNRVKQYILEEGIPVDFLVDLGVMTPEGKVVKSKYDKFRQINRYLEFVKDIREELPKDRTIRIVDFGCGKSYLTFALYYYLHQVCGWDVDIIGLDLKEDVIARCGELAKRYNYSGLHFEKGDIAAYENTAAVDMVVSLHACDTATDFALEKAVKWGAKVIFAVPCCQKEINRQIKSEMLEPILRYGILKERFSALLTDGLRAGLLEQLGYHVQVLEFIEMEHTPKNLLIRAVKDHKIIYGRREREDSEKLNTIMSYFQITPTLNDLLNLKSEIAEGKGSDGHEDKY
jgi:SAM-dependent methyltransferase